MPKKVVFAATGVILVSALSYVIAEGIYALSHGARAETSLGYAVLARILWTPRPSGPDPRDASSRLIADASQIKTLLPQLRAMGVGLGNSPFHDLQTDEAALNIEVDGCLWQKPNQRKVMSYLRSDLYNPFDQITYFHDADRVLPPELEHFLGRYGFRKVYLTTNEHGERVTLPRVDIPDKVLIAGDSVANGVMLDDGETLASQLQAADPAHQYVNLGVSRAASADIVCNLERAARRYAGQVRALLYVFCENDFSPDAPYGTSDELVAWLAEFRRREAIERVTLLYAPYIYNAAPEVTRVRGHSHFAFPTYAEEKRRLLESSAREGFGVVDFLVVADDESRTVGSQFAPLSLYVDHTHFSKAGVERVLPHIQRALALGAR